MPEEDRKDLGNSTRVMIGLWQDGTIGYLNPRYEQVAREAGADANFVNTWGLGTNYLAVCPGPIRKRLQALIETTLAQNAVRESEYICPSPTHKSTYRLAMYPFVKVKAVLLVHTLIRNFPFEASELHPPKYERYQNAMGIVVQCMQCRCVRVASDPTLWEFVPAYVERMPEDMSHGICDACLVHYF